MDHSIKLFVFAAFLLVVISFALNRFGNSEHAYAAGGVTYKTLKWDADTNVEQYGKLLNEQGKDGWHLVAAPNAQHPYLVFEK